MSLDLRKHILAHCQVVANKRIRRMAVDIAPVERIADALAEHVVHPSVRPFSGRVGVVIAAPLSRDNREVFAQVAEQYFPIVS